DDDAVAGLELIGEDPDLLAVAQQPTAARADFHQATNGPLRALERDAFETFSKHPDEDDLGGHERLAGQDGGDAGERQRQVGADAPFQETFERAVQDARSAQHGCDERDLDREFETRQRESPRPRRQRDAGAGGPPRQERPQVQADEQAEKPGQQVEREPALLAKGLLGVGYLAVHASPGMENRDWFISGYGGERAQSSDP